jgi:hypothetical protein
LIGCCGFNAVDLAEVKGKPSFEGISEPSRVQREQLFVVIETTPPTVPACPDSQVLKPKHHQKSRRRKHEFASNGKRCAFCGSETEEI